MRQQRANDLLVSVIRRTHQRSHAVLIPRVHISNTTKNALQFVHVIGLSHAPQVLRRRVDEYPLF